ncbi:hypothetical protein MBRA1_000409 [Malassezia brasiliensis]|uniref:HCP-like protein n=1 Tax=Malassezia brasiliensis TaxID=1821822 RepID=A0AAF0DQH8_9BASI|nr:hypothetical protein MBRA1_000409 [Malassezia brasiliensis]
MSFLPDLPSGFGSESAYPPMPSHVASESAGDMMRSMSPPRPPRAPGSGASSPRPAFMQHAEYVLEPNPRASPFPQSVTTHGATSEWPTSPYATASDDGRTPVYVPASNSRRPSTPSVQMYAAHPASPQRGQMPVPPPPQRILPVEPPSAPSEQSTRVSSSAPVVPVPQRAPPARTPPAQPAPIHVPLPDTKTLAEQRERAHRSGQESDLLHWSMQVVKYVERMQASETQVDEQVTQWIDEAIVQIVQAASLPDPPAEALYARGDLLAGGSFPTYVTKDLRSAFSDFERSARKGYAPSWFRIGRDYETLGDIARARSAYTRGVNLSDVSSTYRMGMATLLGQLDVSANAAEGVRLLRTAADMSTVDTPHPAYIYALLLVGELEGVHVPYATLAEAEGLPAGAAPEAFRPAARKYLQRAAYLNLALAQYKCGWCFEHAQLSFPFDPLMSVQYYSAASQGGEPDADMALSKWFLCGAEGCFDKNEMLAWTFAERAAKHQLPTAEFALGYYMEVGIGTPVNLAGAQRWYEKAAAQGNTDASDRLTALKHSQEAQLSRAQHQENLDARLYSEHTLARSRSTDQPVVSANGPRHTELTHKQTMRMVDASVRRQRVERTRTPAPTSSAQTPPVHGGEPVQYGRSDAPRPAAAGPSGTKRGPATFSEMGLQPKQDRDCTIC